jgi:hypothetical protein
MTEWFYKATPKKIPYAATSKLALQDGFLCRSAFTKTGARVANTMGVSFGDIIHFYFSAKGRITTIGSFEVASPDKHEHPMRFGAMVPKTKLFEVTDPIFDAYLQSLLGEEGYRPDPVLKKMTGWILRKRDLKTPTYDPAVFPMKTTLVRGSVISTA